MLAAPKPIRRRRPHPFLSLHDAKKSIPWGCVLDEPRSSLVQRVASQSRAMLGYKRNPFAVLGADEGIDNDAGHTCLR